MDEPLPEVSIVVPILDDSATMAELLRRLARALRSRGVRHEVVVVDDGSSRAHLARLRVAVAADPAARLVELDGTHGQLSAIVCGLGEARGPVVVSMDGDLQDPPEEVGRLLDGLAAGAQVAKGRRRQLHAVWWRRLGSRAVTLLAGHLLGVRLSDYGGQFNAYGPDARAAVLGAWHRGTPLIPLACALGLDVREVLVERDPRQVGRSRYKLPELVGIAADLVVDFAPARDVAAVVVSSTAVALAGARFARRARSGAGLGAGLAVCAGAAAVPVLLVARGASRRRRSPAFTVRPTPVGRPAG